MAELPDLSTSASQTNSSPVEPQASLNRLALLRQWLERRFGIDGFDIAPASSDASFRRYFRVTRAAGPSLIAMDAPPELENCEPFVRIAALFREAGIHVPELIDQDLAQGFLLLSDLGTTTYLDQLRPQQDVPSGKEPAVGPRASASANTLYEDAMRSLVTLQRASRTGTLPEYDHALLQRELKLFPDWYVQRQCRVTLDATQSACMASAFKAILENNLAQPRVFVHRDYHSRNLMVCEPNPGILDFQDAVYGPITYDLVSLLRDAYVEWEEEQVIDWCIRYWDMARRAKLPVSADFAEFYRDFEWMGVQRQIKVVGIFARLFYRDGKNAYLRDQPLVLRYLIRTCRRYRELAGFARLVEELPALAAAGGEPSPEARSTGTA